MDTKRGISILSMVIIIAVIAFGLLIIGLTLGYSKQAAAPDSTESINVQEQEGVLYTITSTTTVESDMDAYVESADSAPNPNDFNDSYSDLN